MSIDRSLSQFYQPFSQAYESLVDTCSRAEFWHQVKDEVCTPEMLANIGITIATGFAGGLVGGFVEGRILGAAGFQNIERLGFSYLGKLLIQKNFREFLVRGFTHQVNMAMVSGVCDFLGSGHYDWHAHASSFINFNASHTLNWLAFPLFHTGIQNAFVRYGVQRLMGGAVFTVASHVQQSFERRVGWQSVIASESEAISQVHSGDHHASLHSARDDNTIAQLLREYIHNTFMDAGVHHGNQLARAGIQASAQQFVKTGRKLARKLGWGLMGAVLGAEGIGVMQAPPERKVYASGIHENLGAITVTREKFLKVTEAALLSEDLAERRLGFRKRALMVGLPGWGVEEIFPEHVLEIYESELRKKQPKDRGCREEIIFSLGYALERLKENPQIFRRLLASFAFQFRNPELHDHLVRLVIPIVQNPLFKSCTLPYGEGLFENLSRAKMYASNSLSAQRVEVLRGFPVEALDLEDGRVAKQVCDYLYNYQLEIGEEAFSEKSKALDLTRLSPKQWRIIVEHAIAQLWSIKPDPLTNTDPVGVYKQNLQRPKAIKTFLRERRIDAEQARSICEGIENTLSKEPNRIFLLTLLPLLCQFAYPSRFRELRSEGVSIYIHNTQEVSFWNLSVLPLLSSWKAAELVIAHISEPVVDLENSKLDPSLFLAAIRAALSRPTFRAENPNFFNQINRSPLCLSELPSILEILIEVHEQPEFFDPERIAQRQNDVLQWMEYIAEEMTFADLNRALSAIRDLRPSREARRNLILAMARKIPLTHTEETRRGPITAYQVDDCIQVLKDHTDTIEELQEEARRVLESRLIEEAEVMSRNFLQQALNEALRLRGIESAKRLELLASMENARNSEAEGLVAITSFEEARRFVERFLNSRKRMFYVEEQSLSFPEALARMASPRQEFAPLRERPLDTREAGLQQGPSQKYVELGDATLTETAARLRERFRRGENDNDLDPAAAERLARDRALFEAMRLGTVDELVSNLERLPPIENLPNIEVTREVAANYNLDSGNRNPTNRMMQGTQSAPAQIVELMGAGATVIANPVAEDYRIDVVVPGEMAMISRRNPPPNPPFPGFPSSSTERNPEQVERGEQGVQTDQAVLWARAQETARQFGERYRILPGVGLVPRDVAERIERREVNEPAAAPAPATQTPGFLARVRQGANNLANGVREFLGMSVGALGELVSELNAEEVLRRREENRAPVNQSQLQNTLETWWQQNAASNISFKISFDNADDFQVVIQGPSRSVDLEYSLSYLSRDGLESFYVRLREQIAVVRGQSEQ